MAAIETAAAVRAGTTTAASLVESALAAIDAREPEIHAFNLVLADQARADAAAIDARVAAGEDPGLLAGVTVALKDNMCTRGIPTTCSSRILEGWKPPYDATVVERLRAAGWRIEPPVSVPSASGAMPAATAADEPPLEPPGTRAGSHGLCVGP